MSDSPVDLRDLLDAPGTDFPDRPNLPGNKHFFGKLIDIKAGHSRNKGTPQFEFGVRLTDPGKDVSREDLAPIFDAGFNLADYNVTYVFYLTPKAMPMLWSFLESVGFQRTLGLRQALSLAPDGNPTAETIDKIRGLDVLCKTQPKDENGRVYSNLDTIVGVKR